MSRGHDRERQVKRLLEGEDWWVCRAAGSLGDADLVALKPGKRWLIECKSTAAGPFHSFGPKDRERLRFAADLADCTPVLCWWPPRGKPRWLFADEWPRSEPRACAYCGRAERHPDGPRPLNAEGLCAECDRELEDAA